MTARKDITIADLPAIAMRPLMSALRRWWWQRAEDHYLICADVESAKAAEAMANAAYYQKKAAFAKSARTTL